MPRYTSIAWWCNPPCNQRNTFSLTHCARCGTPHYEKYANVRASERAVIDVGLDGSISVPGRADRPLHPKQIAAGVQRVEIESAITGRHSLSHLESLGLVHEATNWNSQGGNMPLVHEDTPNLTRKSVEQILAEPDTI